MHRVLSIEASRCSDTSREFVSKRLCISFLFTIAFFSLLGGFLLGRYALDRRLKNGAQSKQSVQAEDPTTVEKLQQQLTLSIFRIHELTGILSTTNTLNFSYSELHSMLMCNNLSSSNVPPLEHFKTDLHTGTKEFVEAHLILLQNCFNNVIKFLS